VVGETPRCYQALGQFPYEGAKTNSNLGRIGKGLADSLFHVTIVVYLNGLSWGPSTIHRSMRKCDVSEAATRQLYTQYSLCSIRKTVDGCVGTKLVIRRVWRQVCFLHA
jgi:hypothetical protein